VTLPSDLRAWAEGELGAHISDVAPIGAGASRQIWRVTAGATTCVLRVDPGTGPVAGTELDLAREAVVYTALAATTIPVPRLLATAPDGRALLMELCAGSDALAAVADADTRAAVGRDYLMWLGRLHTLDARSLDLPGIGGPATARDGTLADLDLWARIAGERTIGWATPAVAPALDWLRDAAPSAPGRAALCHGDAGPGNFLFAGERVTAMLDWEFAHVGDPHDDLAWVSVRNHLLGRPFDVAGAVGGWSATTGCAVDSARAEYYRVVVLIRMAISCDATLTWKDGVEDDSIRTQSLLRPWLGAAITTALGFAGCDATWLAGADAQARHTLDTSPHAALLALIPPLEPLELA
jgi:aminoglycoside phosphotransferase (APT) family kinase protein